MAKRTTPRSEAGDASAAPSTRGRRPSVKTSPGADTIGADPGVERCEDDGTVAQAIANASSTDSNGTSLSDDEIRERAYHRYLERGGHSGSEFDDWVEAERELRNRR
jgi:Protein of unknown function (DUF2934)